MMRRAVLVAALGALGMVAAVAAEPIETRSMPMAMEVGEECPTTGVRVEAVTPAEDAEAQTVVISIPRRAVADTPNLKLYRADSSAVAFQQFKELRDSPRDRRSFSVVVGEAEKFVFKVGFDSSQNL